MGSIDENKDTWDITYDWTAQGDEWSEPWGGVDMQWTGCLLPRMHAFVPAPTILEIAPGYGRWTQYLKEMCDRLIVVDCAENCIKACEQRFASSDNIEYHVNDGRSLAMVPDGAVDLVFSFDSLVHAEADVIEAYLTQLADKLTPNGVGFIHHSNIGEFKDYYTRVKSPKTSSPLDKLSHVRGVWRVAKMFDNSPPPEDTIDHWRAYSMTATKFNELAEKAGLRCLSQEIINWRTSPEIQIDCISTFTRKGSSWERPNQVLVNRGFMDETNAIAKLARLYGSASFPRVQPEPARR
jgi:SAM-dependent methyltransferase